MDLESLKAEWEKAQADAAKNPEDTGLAKAAADAEKAYNDAVAAANENRGDDPFDENKLDEKTKAYLAKLRKENAGHRNKNKELASKFNESEEKRKAMLKAAGLLEEEKPEEQLQAAEAKKQELAFRAAILESAIDHGIPKDKLKYYSYLISEAANELEEGEELSDEALEAIVKECRGGAGKKPTSTVTQPNGAPKPGSQSDMTLEKFCSLSMVEKSKLYQDNPTQYEAFMLQAKAKKKLV